MWMLSVRSSECIDTLPGCDLYIYACTAIWELFVLVLYRILRKKILPLNCQWLLLQRKMDIFFREISFWAYSIMTESARKWRGGGAEKEKERKLGEWGPARTCPVLLTFTQYCGRCYVLGRLNGGRQKWELERCTTEKESMGGQFEHTRVGRKWGVSMFQQQWNFMLDLI